MNSTQRRACAERLDSIDHHAARRFRQLADSAAELIADGYQAQRQAWDLFYEVTGERPRQTSTAPPRLTP